MKMTGFYGYFYDFSDDYDVIEYDDMLDIHKYLMRKNNIKRSLDLLKNRFFTAMTFFSFNALNVILLKCISMNNQECKIRPKILNSNSNEPLFFPYSVLVNKFSGIVIILMTHLLHYVFLIY